MILLLSVFFVFNVERSACASFNYSDRSWSEENVPRTTVRRYNLSPHPSVSVKCVQHLDTAEMLVEVNHLSLDLKESIRISLDQTEQERPHYQLCTLATDKNNMMLARSKG